MDYAASAATPHERGAPPLSTLLAHLRAESGQTMAEYAVVLGVITIAVVVTLGLLSTADRTPFFGPAVMRVLVGFLVCSGVRIRLGFGS